MSKILETLKNYKYKYYNIRLLFWVCVLTILGIFVIASATDSNVYEKKQILGFSMGLFIVFVASLVSYKFLLKFYWIFYLLNLVLLIWVKVAGAYRMGATRWIDLGFFQLQPSEFTKILLLLFFAKFLYNRKDRINTVSTIFSSLLLFIIPLLLVLKQPDLSTSIIICVTFCGILFIAGLSYKIIGGTLAVVIPVAVILVYLIMQPDQHIIESYQLDRIIGFYDENSEVADRIRYQQENSIMAIGSGGLKGKGLNNNTTTSVKNGKYISEPQTDFIFCIVGEELGFIGTSAVIILLFLIIMECFYTGAHAPDLAGRIISCGYGVLITIQSFVNIAVVTMLIPNTGLPLPFVSYGLSSLISLYAGLGVILNISLQRKEIQL